MSADRRTFLAACAVPLGVSVAGCGADDDFGADGLPGSGGDDTPDFEVREDAPARFEIVGGRPDVEAVQYRDTFDASLFIGNTGGQPTEEEQTVGVTFACDETDAVDEQSRKVVVPELESGEAVELTAGPFTAEVSGEWRFEDGRQIEGVYSEYDPAVTVAPLTVQESETAPFGEQLEIRVTDTRPSSAQAFYEDGAFNNHSGLYGLSAPPTGEVFLDIYLEFTNTGDSEVGVGGYDNYIIEGNNLYTGYNKGSGRGRYPTVSFEDAVGVEAAHISTVSVGAGETETGWLSGPVPVDALSDPTRLECLVFGEETTPDVAIELDITAADVPEFEVADVEFTAEDETYSRMDVTVENVADVGGEFKGTLLTDGGYGFDETDGFATGAFFNTEIAAGGTATFSAEVLRGRLYKIHPIDSVEREVP